MLEKTSFQKAKTYKNSRKEQVAAFLGIKQDSISSIENVTKDQNVYVNITITNGNFSIEEFRKILQEKNVYSFSIGTITNISFERSTEINIEQKDLEQALLPTTYYPRAKRSITFEL